MKILGIETSCDETAAAVIEDGTTILSNVIASSAAMHEKTGGIIPEMAAREQIRCILPVIEEALRPDARRGSEQAINKKILNNKRISINSTILSLLSTIDAIAVTIGPGLIGSLLVGVETAKTISYVTGKPIIPVNHVLAHIYANFLSDQDTSGVANGLSRGGGIKTMQFPSIALVVSGGHTELFLMKSKNSLKWLGGTLDDAAGEAFDKTARLLGLGFPGGPAIAASAAKYQISNIKYQIKLPRPMIDSKDLNFSFSGLKTAVLREVNKLKTMGQLDNETINYLSYEIQESITDVLVAKTITATKQYNVRSILLGGGVAANQRLSEKMLLEIKNFKLEIDFLVPPPSLCTDNAAYIASYAYFHNDPIPWQDIQAQPNLSVEI